MFDVFIQNIILLALKKTCQSTMNLFFGTSKIILKNINNNLSEEIPVQLKSMDTPKT